MQDSVEISLIKEHGFDGAYKVAFDRGDFIICKKIKKLEYDVFGTYKTGMSGTSQFTICSNPVRMDLYNRCKFGCVYCFAENRQDDVVVSVDTKIYIDNLRNSLIGNGKDSFSVMIRQGWPVHIGGMSDPFPPRERYTHSTFSALEVLSEYNYPAIISTKSDLLLHCNDYVDLISDMKDNLIFQMSLITVNHYEVLEPYAPPPQNRIKTLKVLCDKGVNCIVRLQPFMYQMLEEQKDLFKIYADIGVKGVIVEGLKINRNQFANNRLREKFFYSLGVNLNNTLTGRLSGDSVYPCDIKYTYNYKLREYAHNNGLLFFVGDNDFRFMGDSPNCCGTDLISAKTNTSNITHLAYMHKEDFGYHLIKDINNEYMSLRCDEKGFQAKSSCVKDVLRESFNNCEFDTYEKMYTDDAGDIHYKIKDKYL